MSNSTYLPTYLCYRSCIARIRQNSNRSCARGGRQLLSRHCLLANSKNSVEVRSNLAHINVTRSAGGDSIVTVSATHKCRNRRSAANECSRRRVTMRRFCALRSLGPCALARPAVLAQAGKPRVDIEDLRYIGSYICKMEKT